MTIILPSNAYKDFNVEPYLAPTLQMDPVRNDMIEEQKKTLADLESQLGRMKKQLASLESELAQIEIPYSFGPREILIRTSMGSLKSAIGASNMMIEMMKAELNRTH